MVPTLDGVKSDPVLGGWLDWLVGTYGEGVAFAVLYGSRARGTARRHSDYDVLVGLSHESPARYLDRLEEFNHWDEFPQMEAKALTPSEIDSLWWHLGRTLLDPLYEGIVLLDRGPWAEMRERYERILATGALCRSGTAWEWHRELDPDLEERLERCRVASRRA